MPVLRPQTYDEMALLVASVNNRRDLDNAFMRGPKKNPYRIVVSRNPADLQKLQQPGSPVQMVIIWPEKEPGFMASLRKAGDDVAAIRARDPEVARKRFREQHVVLVHGGGKPPNLAQKAFQCAIGAVASGTLDTPSYVAGHWDFQQFLARHMDGVDMIDSVMFTGQKGGLPYVHHDLSESEVPAERYQVFATARGFGTALLMDDYPRVVDLSRCAQEGVYQARQINEMAYEGSLFIVLPPGVVAAGHIVDARSSDHLKRFPHVGLDDPARVAITGFVTAKAQDSLYP